MNGIGAIKDPFWELSALEEGLVELDIKQRVESIVNVNPSEMSQVSGISRLNGKKDEAYSHLSVHSKA